MNKNDDKLIMEAYSEVQNKSQPAIGYAGFWDHENYEDIYVTKDPRINDRMEYVTPINKRFALFSNNDEEISVHTEADTLEELVTLVNNVDGEYGSGWYDGEDPTVFTLETLIQMCKDSYVDKDSSSGFYLVDMANETVIAEPSHGSGADFYGSDYFNDLDNEE